MARQSASILHTRLHYSSAALLTPACLPTSASVWRRTKQERIDALNSLRRIWKGRIVLSSLVRGSDSPKDPTPPEAWIAVAPARVNLIGEHTDYTGGYVLPMAIPFSTTATLTIANDGKYHFKSSMSDEERTMDPRDRSERIGHWSDYVVGVLRQLQKLNIEPAPFILELRGDVPLGAGLSSSASVEIAAAQALVAFSGKSFMSEALAVLCQRAENQYVNSPCGIMDQFVVAAARAQHALLLNTRDLTYEFLPMDRSALASCCIVVANSMVKHSIADGDYGLRRHEVEAGQAVLRNTYPNLRDLGDATLNQLESCRVLMTKESYRRCRHIITENGRVLEAKAAMMCGDPVQLGKVMTLAHASERDDFECSIDEIDFLVETALESPGCYGARLTGGGFGGCTVNLVEAANAEYFCHDLQRAYRDRFNLDVETYICAAVDGAVVRLASEQSARDSQS